MTQAALKAALAGCVSLSPANATVTVCLAARGSSGTMPSLHRLQLSTALAESFLLTAADTLRDLHHDIAKGNRSLETYDAGNVPDKHEVEFHTPPAGSTPEAVVKALSTLQQLPVFDGKAATIDKLVFHVIAILAHRPVSHLPVPKILEDEGAGPLEETGYAFFRWCVRQDHRAGIHI